MSGTGFPSIVEGALIDDLRYVADFGRIEANVVLVLSDQSSKSQPISILTSVPAVEGEEYASLYTRLTQDAAHLWRLLEVEAKSNEQFQPLAA